MRSFIQIGGVVNSLQNRRIMDMLAKDNGGVINQEPGSVLFLGWNSVDCDIHFAIDRYLRENLIEYDYFRHDPEECYMVKFRCGHTVLPKVLKRSFDPVSQSFCYDTNPAGEPFISMSCIKSIVESSVDSETKEQLIDRIRTEIDIEYIPALYPYVVDSSLAEEDVFEESFFK